MNYFMLLFQFLYVHFFSKRNLLTIYDMEVVVGGGVMILQAYLR